MFNSKFGVGVLKHPGYNGGKGGSAPSTPDYTALANAQGANNLALAQYTTQANRVNQVTPYGNITYSQGSPTVDQAGYNAALQAYNQQLFHAMMEKKITLIDYECLEHEDGQRLIGFGFLPELLVPTMV